MKLKKKGLLTLLTALAVSALAFIPTSAANNSNIISIAPNKVVKYQLDGKGSKEKIRLVTKDTEVEEFMEGDRAYNHIFTATLKINEKTVYKNSYNYYKSTWGFDEELKAELVLADVSQSDKSMDLFLGVYDRVYSGTYKDLVRVTYKNGRTTIDKMLNTLKAIKSPKATYHYGSSNMLNPLESYTGLANGDIVVPGNGAVQWITCLYTGTSGGDYVHSYITLTLKGNKLKAKDYPSGVHGLDTGGSELLKNIDIYKSAGSSQKVATIKKGQYLHLTGDFKFIKKKLYLEVDSNGQSGWVPYKALSVLKNNGTDHA